MFERAGVKLIDPGCGACIGAVRVSNDVDQVTVSAINRNYGSFWSGQTVSSQPVDGDGQCIHWKDICMGSGSIDFLPNVLQR